MDDMEGWVEVIEKAEEHKNQPIDQELELPDAKPSWS